MFTSHLKQFLNLKYPDFPLLFTNTENLVGKYSSGYKKTKHELTVFKKVVKYSNLLCEGRIYKLFVFDEENKCFDVVERKECEDLTENFGFEFKNDVIDSLKEGDTIKKGTVLYRSTSYDDDMNYCYGKNVTVAYTLDPFTSEDAAVVSKSLAKALTSIESEVIPVGLNTNDYLVNIYGDKYNYKPLPDIGEKVNDVLCVVRRQFNDQLLFDFKDSSLRQILDSDSVYHIDKDVEIIDYDIYNNNEEEIDNPFYEQINKYMHEQDKYYRDIIEVFKEIEKSGYPYTREVDYLYKRATEFLDKQKKWKENDSSFANMKLEIHVKSDKALSKGCKFTGRYGYGN